VYVFEVLIQLASILNQFLFRVDVFKHGIDIIEAGRFRVRSVGHMG
jgi:hypothetical protein